ncbi:MAG: helix-turn-helix transcriptional regulator [Burkholderiaceae bacterium]|nr:helix-turn-helix transcriptional regulator [Burkholderiaceae bacterium]MDZ4146080.1 helix-turn-helix transcriptional regulator [Burkholderiales bacterium]
MSSTILQNYKDREPVPVVGGVPPVLASNAADELGRDDKHPFLVALGERTRALRARRGMTRKALAMAADVSERHLANLEYGLGNASILVLLQVSQALHCSLAELIGDVSTASPEWLMLRELLEGRDEAALHRVRVAVGELLGTGGANAQAGGLARKRSERVALIGLRGAGKSTLGAMLAEDLGYPFVELSREVEKFAGCSISEIQALYGQNAYRRYERRALEEAIQIYPEAVIATPGGIVSDPANFNVLLAHCTTVWLKAEPEDHMKRVLAQGDTRPMAASREAMEDLKSILAGRTAFYSKAEFTLNTSQEPLASTFLALRVLVRKALELSV